jgi:hypothetical protein
MEKKKKENFKNKLWKRKFQREFFLIDQATNPWKIVSSHP